MKVLHVLKSEPDDVTKALIKPFSEGDEAQQFELFDGNPDYDELVKLVFESDKVICWW